MYVLVNHNISDPTKFWADPERFFASIPKSLKLHATYPTKDGRRATCLWEGSSLDEIKSFVEKSVGTISKNEFVPIDEEKAFGLPKRIGREEPRPSAGR